MSIWVIANTVGYSCAQLVATDTSDAATSTQANVSTVRGGPRHLKWTSDHATAARRIAYVDKTGNLAANFVCMVDAAAHVGKNVKIIEFTSYGGTEANIDSRTLDTADLAGYQSQDWVYKFSSTYSSKQAFAIEFGATDYQKTARQIYVGEGLEFSDVPPNYEISLSRVSIREPLVEYKGQRYKLWATASLSVTEVSKSLLQSYENLYKDDPLFFYDSSGTNTIGNAIEEKFWHAVVLSEQITPLENDVHQIDWQLGLLRN